MTAKNRLLLVALLALVGVALSGVLLQHHHGETATASQLCGEGAESGCDVVNTSRWSSLGGVPLAGLGLVFFGALGALALLGALAGDDTGLAAARLLFLAVAAGLAVDLVLLGLQAFSIGAFCKLCLGTYAVNLVALALLWPLRSSPGLVAPPVETRLVLAGAAVAALAVALGTYAYDQTLAQRAATRAANLLGGGTPRPVAPAPQPAPPETTPPAPTTTLPPATSDEAKKYQEEAEKARAEARRLQDTIDDPQRLEQYFAAKAMREFEQTPPAKLDLKDVPMKGPASAPIHVVEYSDFLCPFCRNLALAFGPFLQQTGDRVAIHFKNYPLESTCNPALTRTVHAGACNLALGAVCANEQGKFWSYHDKVFGKQKDISNPSTKDVVGLAAEAGLDWAAFEQCLGSDKAKQVLAGQIAEARGLAVNSTPTVLINGRKVARLNDFEALIDKELARLGQPPLPKPTPPGH
jgi:protein-disulfide isomerase/uncharacterized membrane protein